MNVESVKSFVAHIIAGLAGATSMLLIVGLSQGDASRLGDAFKQIGDGVVSIVAGLSILVPILTGLYGAYKQTRTFTLNKMNEDPQIEKVETKPGTAAAEVANKIPGEKISVATSLK